MPSLDILISDVFQLNDNQRFARKNLFIEIDGEGDKYFERAIVEKDSGSGKHIWEFSDKNYVSDPLPIINIFELHPTRRVPRLNGDSSDNTFTEKIDNLIHSEATISILLKDICIVVMKIVK